VSGRAGLSGFAGGTAQSGPTLLEHE